MKEGLSVNEQETIKALKAEGKTFFAISKVVNRSPHTVKRYLLSSPEVQAHVEQIKDDLASMFEGVAKRMIASITDGDILKLDGYRRTLSAGIATDKMRLLRDQATHNISSLTKIVEACDPIRRPIVNVIDGTEDQNGN